MLLRQAGELEKFTGISGKIIVKWKAVRTEIEKITVSPDAIPAALPGGADRGSKGAAVVTDGTDIELEKPRSAGRLADSLL